MKKFTTLDQFEKICSEALKNASMSKNSKGIRKLYERHLRRLILDIIVLFIVLPRKINFTQMEKYGWHTEKTYRQAFCTKIDWIRANLELMQRVIKPEDRLAIAIDPSYINKSGKHTPWTGMFWSGCASSSKWGLEILGISIIDIDLHSSFALRTVQSPDTKTLGIVKKTLYEWYAFVLRKYMEHLMSISKYVVADAAFSNSTFIGKLDEMGFHLVSRLRDDCKIMYLYNGPKKKTAGRPREYDGIVDKKNLRSDKVEEIKVEGIDDKLYTFIGYHCTLKRKLRIVVRKVKNGKTKVYFSTDTKMSGKDVVEYYSTRFQIEFVFRDSKEYTGLCDCQARNLDKMDFAFNASLFATNAAKVIWFESGCTISMSALKSLMVNLHLGKKIFSMFGFRPNLKFINRFNQALVDFQLDAC